MSDIAICHIDDIEEDRAKGFSHGEQTLFGVKKDGQLFFYLNNCPHLGIELEWLEDQFLDSENALIQCSTHGALFLIESGQCVSGPCVGDKLKSLEHRVANDGQVFITL